MMPVPPSCGPGVVDGVPKIEPGASPPCLGSLARSRSSLAFSASCALRNSGEEGSRILRRLRSFKGFFR